MSITSRKYLSDFMSSIHLQRLLLFVGVGGTWLVSPTQGAEAGGLPGFEEWPELYNFFACERRRMQYVGEQ